MAKSKLGAVRPIGKLFKIALSAGIEAAVKLHIARGDDLECRDGSGLTPLMIAASRNRSGVCKLLLSAGADVHAVDAGGRDALTIARECSAMAAAEAILAVLDQRSAAVVPLAVTHPVGAAEQSRPAIAKGDPGISAEAEPKAVTASDEQLHSRSASKSSAEGCAQLKSAPGEAAEVSPSPSFVAEPEPTSPAHSSNGCDLIKAIAPLPNTLSVTAGDGNARNSCVLRPIAKQQLLVPQQSGTYTSRGEPGCEQRDTSETLDGECEPLVGLTFGDWEAAEMSVPPSDNPIVAAAEAARQRRIDSHTAIDQDASWDDFEALLPESAKPPPRVQDQVFGEALRELLLRGVREGSVPRVAIEDAFSGRHDGEERNPQGEAALERVLGDMGVEIDERLELPSANPSENFEVYVDPVETSDEEPVIDDAILHFEEQFNDRNDPFKLYHRAVVRVPLLSAEQETDLARKMEAAVSGVLDALARWPGGLNHLLDEVRKAEAGISSLSNIVVSRDSDSDDVESNGDIDVGVIDGNVSAISDFETDDDEDASYLGLIDGDGSAEAAGDPIDIFNHIHVLVAESTVEGTPSALRQELGRLRFRRPFLISLDDLAAGDCHSASFAYRHSIAELIRYRDQMAQANLRLVMDIARRRMNSGLSIEDLIQEGNLGLLKAVDRFDWRRGFRFSTMATWWIRQQIGRGICDSALAIRLPVHMHERVSRRRQEIQSLERMRGKQSTLGEKAAICGLAPEKFELAARAFSDPLSIDEVQQEGWFESEEADGPFAHLATREEARVIDALLARLKRKDAEVLRWRFGIGIPDARTLDQIGGLLGVTRERVRQIEGKAMRKLCSSPYVTPLAEALGRSPPQRKTATDEDEVPIGDEASPKSATTVRSGEAASPPETASRIAGADLTDVTSMPVRSLPGDQVSAHMQRLLDLAQELGVPVSQDPSESSSDLVFGEIEPVDRKSRRLIRDLLEQGFTWQAGIGYRR